MFGIDIIDVAASVVLTVFVLTGWAGVKALWGRITPAKKG